MPPKTRPQGESKKGLIITLVFFILATIGFGVATYFGFSEQDRLEKAAKQAGEEKRIAENNRDWYKFQSHYYRSIMGVPPSAEDLTALGSNKEKFDSDRLPAPGDKDEVRKVIKDNLEKKFGWNAKENKPEKTYESTIAELTAQNEQLAKSSLDLDTAVKSAKKQIEKKDEELREAQKTYETNLADLTKKNKEDFDKSLKDLQDMRALVERRAEELTQVRAKGEEDKKAINTQKEKLDSDIKFLKERIKDQETRLAATQARSSEAPASMRTDWKITRMDSRGGNPYINLGSTDLVKPQLTFSIHGVGTDGRPNPQSKGTLEVVNVIGDHLSQTRITSVKDRNRDPILEGDVIYNPSWNPTLKKHVAVAGIIDLTGDGRDNLSEFMRSLERQNIIVDAYVDPKDGSVKGKITFRTDYLILGDVPDATVRGKAVKEENPVITGRRLMQEEAKKYGVPSIGLLRYLETTGYRMPHGMHEERPSLYNPDYRPETAPRLGGDKVPPATVPDR